VPKIVILGSCKHEPYEILFVPKKIPGLWNTEEGYRKASERCYSAIDKCDEVWVYAPEGIGEHTRRDLEYARSRGKKVRFLVDEERLPEAKYLNTVKLRRVGRAKGVYRIPVPPKAVKFLGVKDEDEFSLKVDKKKRRLIYEPINRQIKVK